jgi:hypothetical protein
VYRNDVIEHAYHRVKAKKGAPGIDGITFEAIEEEGAERYVETIAEELRNKNVQAPAGETGVYPETDWGQKTAGHVSNQGQGSPDGGQTHHRAHIRGRLSGQFPRLQAGKRRPPELRIPMKSATRYDPNGPSVMIEPGHPL